MDATWEICRWFGVLVAQATFHPLWALGTELTDLRAAATVLVCAGGGV